VIDVVGAPPPPAATSPALVIDFGGTGAIEMARVNDKREAYASVLVRNDSKSEGVATLQVTAVDRDGVVVTSTEKDIALKGGTVTRVTVRVPGGFNQAYDRRLPARGVAVLSVLEKGKADATPAIKAREVIIRQVDPSAAERLVTMVGLVAGVIVLLVGLGVALQQEATTPSRLKGEPKWTAQSWSSNLALGGALLTPILTIAGLPAVTHYASKTSYTTLSVFYGALVALAPAVFGLLKGRDPKQRDIVRMLALASAVTVWATVGQLGTAALLVLELAAARVLSGLSAYAAVGLFAAIAVLVAVHAIRVFFEGPVPATRPAATGGGTTPVPPPAIVNAAGGAAPAVPPTTVTTDDWCLL
jgi:hypothetical protein